jgi:hypothetical protein
MVGQASSLSRTWARSPCHPLLEELEERSSNLSHAGHQNYRDLERHFHSLLTDIQGKNFSAAQSHGSSIARAIIEPINILTSRPGPYYFGQVNESMIRKLTELVWCEKQENVRYLTPFVLQGLQDTLTVATLNYDNTIELACEAVGVPCTIGLENWAQQGEFRKPPHGIELLKLHGSVDWSWIPDPAAAPGIPISYGLVQQVPLGERRTPPVLIFGGGNKLTTTGPFLDLLKAFQRRLEEKDVLLVIGYSFRDMHINEIIIRWINDQ